MLKTLVVMHKIIKREVDYGISTRLLAIKKKDFHAFLLKKDINLLILHQNRELWINLSFNSKSRE